jgi:hypothetical protein
MRALSRLAGEEGRWHRNLLAVACLVVFASLLAPRRADACVGEGCLQLWSTADGGGALAMQWDPAKKIQVFESFCTQDRRSCFYTSIDPGFMAPTEATPGSGYYRLVDGTAVRVEVVMVDEGLTMSINGQRLDQPGESASLGTMPTIHNHPAWQLLVPGDVFGDYHVMFRLTTDSPLYEDSELLTLVVTNQEPVIVGTPTPTPTATPEPTPCVGDCDNDGAVTIDEVLGCVKMALGSSEDCLACDPDADGSVTVDEIIAAVTAALDGCPMPPMVTLAEIQETIFTPKCATVFCHDAASANGDLVLVDGLSHSELVGVVPAVPIAAQAGQLLVDPGDPENSFLLIKLLGPPLGGGSRMPLTGDPLSGDEIERIRNWIVNGALP